MKTILQAMIFIASNFFTVLAVLAQDSHDDELNNLGTSAVVFGYVIGIIFLLAMAWTLRREKRDIQDHSRV